MKKTYKEIFDNVHLDKSVDNKILNKTIYKNNNFVLKKIIVPLLLVFIVSITSIGIVYANEIVEKIKNLLVTTTIDFDDEEWWDIHRTELKVFNRKNVNVDAEFSNVQFPVLDNQQKTTFEEIEENLKFEILTSNIFEIDVARIIELEKNGDKISHGWFVFDNVYKTTSGKISMAIEFITEYYEKEYFMVTLRNTRNLDKEYKEVKTNKRLDTDLYIWCPKKIQNYSEIVGSPKVTFIYDDIVYTLFGHNVSVNEILYVINTLEY